MAANVTPDPTADQSDCLSGFRTELGSAIDNITALQARIVKFMSLGGADSFVVGAYAGSNATIAPADVDAAQASVLSIRALLFDGTGAPTPAYLALVKIAR